jgi:hypothetical protein
MKHEWKGGMTPSTPDSPPEGYCYCDNCGAEQDDDNKDGECVPVEDDESVTAPILPPYES